MSCNLWFEKQTEWQSLEEKGLFIKSIFKSLKDATS